jgi:phosphoglycerol transferase
VTIPHTTAEHAGRPSRSEQDAGVRDRSLPILQVVLITALLFVFIKGWRHDLHVPIRFSSDALVFLMQSKSTLDNGWWWSNPMLGAPFEFHALAFPANTNLDQVIIWLVSRFTSSVGLCINVAWMIMVVLSGLTATWSVRLLGASRMGSLVAGTLFALSPFALYRNIDHFNLVIYLVPFPCAAALFLAAGRPPGHWLWKRSGMLLLIGCSLIGFDYAYYAFFACFFLTVGTLVGFVNHRDKRLLLAGAIFVAAISLCTAINLAPSLYTWHVEGKPIIVRDKGPAEAEVYGMKIRQLVSPVFRHSFPPFRRWTEKEAAAQFPLETENMISRLGLIGTIGFLGLLGLLFVPARVTQRDEGKNLLGAAQLNIAAILLATVGGFGSLFSLLVSPEIRAYNRICPFMGFFALASIALLMDLIFAPRTRQHIVAAALLLAIGLLDQSQAAVTLAPGAGIDSELRQLQSFFGQVERVLPNRAMVFQLPITVYLNDTGRARMQPYDHLKPYLASHKIHWSYPALSNRQVEWQQKAARLAPPTLVPYLKGQGFSAILIDRYGYEDQGRALVSEIRSVLNGNVLAENERYTVFDLRFAAGVTQSKSNPGAITQASAGPAPATVAFQACPGEPVMNIDSVGTTNVPAINMAHVQAGREFKVTGWAVDQDAKSVAAALDIMIDSTLFPSFYGIDREDVVAYFKQPAYLPSGFTALIPAGRLAKGRHALSIRIASARDKCYKQSRAIAIEIE